MEIALDRENTKRLGKAIAFLAKSSESLILQCWQGRNMSMTAMNASQSQFAKVTMSHSYFSSIRMLPSLCMQLGGSLDRFMCKLSSKLLSSTFRLTPMTEKSLDRCEMSIKMPPNSFEPYLLICFTSGSGVATSHRLSFEPFQDVIDVGVESASRWQISPKLISHWLNQFPAHEDIAIYTRTQQVANENAPDGNNEDSSSLAMDPFEFGSVHFKSIPGQTDNGGDRQPSTELQLDTMEFDVFEVESDSALSIIMKDFKSILSLAEQLSSAVEAKFTHGGQPIEFSVSTPSMHISFILATATYWAMVEEQGFNSPTKPAVIATTPVKRTVRSEGDDECIPATPPH